MKILKRIITTIFYLIFIGVAFAVYITLGERNLLIVKDYTHNSATVLGQSIKVVQFTDTHLGEFYTQELLDKAVVKINAQNPDMVVFTGDLFDIANQLDDPEKAIASLSNIAAPLGKYAVFGNRDYGGGAVRVYESFMEKAGFTVLVDESVTIEYNGRNISIFGADDYVLGNPNVENLMANIKEENLNIFLVHEPDAMLNYEHYPIDIAFTGHSHGGQVTLPFYGAIIKTTMCDTYFKGLYNLDNNRGTSLFVSSGLGNTKVPFRLGNIPEIIAFNVNF